LADIRACIRFCVTQSNTADRESSGLKLLLSVAPLVNRICVPGGGWLAEQGRPPQNLEGMTSSLDLQKTRGGGESRINGIQDSLTSIDNGPGSGIPCTLSSLRPGQAGPMRVDQMPRARHHFHSCAAKKQ
jgi:hypothetical protein